MARVQKFWNDFVEDPASLQKSQSFSLVLWQGITPATRRDIWSRLGKEYLSNLVASDAVPQLPADVKSEFREGAFDEIENSHLHGLSPRLDPKTVSRVQALLIDHAQRNRVSSYEQGWAQLIATVLGVVEDEPTTLALVQKLYDLLAPYRQDNDRLMMNDMLVLAETIVVEIPQVAQTFNACAFDVVDLADICGSWASCLFASYFPTNAVIRLLDILLFEGPTAIIGNIFGVLKVFRTDIVGQQDGESFFSYLTNIPPSLTERQIDDSLKYGYKVFRVGRKRVEDLRKTKDWRQAVQATGSLMFEAGIGSPRPAPLNNAIEEKLGAILKGKQASHESNTAAAALPEAKLDRIISSSLVHVDPTQLPDVIFRIEKTKRQGDPTTQKLFEEAALVLRKQHEMMQQLRLDAGNTNDESGNASSAESSGSSANELSDTDLVSSSTDRKSSRRGGGRSVPKGCVPHSKLFQYQQFPCLYMEGYLLKARRKSPGKGEQAFGNLHRRFFVLQGSFITYFKSHRQSKPQHDLSVDMRGRQITNLDHHKFGKYGFEVSDLRGNQCLYLLFASNPDERKVWVQVLQAASDA